MVEKNIEQIFSKISKLNKFNNKFYNISSNREVQGNNNTLIYSKLYSICCKREDNKSLIKCEKLLREYFDKSDKSDNDSENDSDDSNESDSDSNENDSTESDDSGNDNSD
jgi:hypothetical protein